jgi:8-oxo-dGTP pyrophosphatase MutT (NUDIX family)
MAQPNEKESDKDTRVWAVITHPTEPHKILLGKRSAQCNNPGAWGLFGGHVDSGEGWLEAVSRELYEETKVRWSSHSFNLIKQATRKGAKILWYYPVDLWKIWAPSAFMLTDEVDAYFWYDTTPGATNVFVIGEEFDLHYSAKLFLKDYAPPNY